MFDATIRSDDEVLRSRLECIAYQLTGQRGAIATIHCRQSEYATSFPCYIVDLCLSNGKCLSLFLKSLGFSHLHKDLMQQRRDRELIVYRDLLANMSLGTAIYYDSVWDHNQGRFWLIIEHVSGIPVRYSDFQYWVSSARWLGRMFAKFSERRDLLDNCTVLQCHDRDYFLSTAKKAVVAVGEAAESLSDRLDRISETYGQVVNLMSNQRPSLVHGSYRPHNILVAAEPVQRICPVDWELAAVGSPLYDLAFLANGFTSPRLELMLDAYRAGAIESGASPPEQTELTALVNCFRLHKVLKSLSESRAKNYHLEVLTRLVDQAADINAQIQEITTG